MDDSKEEKRTIENFTDFDWDKWRESWDEQSDGESDSDQTRIDFEKRERQEDQIEFTQQNSTTPHTCPAAVNRIKNGPENYSKIIGSGNRYTDPTFPHSKNEMVWWPSHPRTDNLSFKNFRVSAFKAPLGNSLFGSKGVRAFDII